VLVERLKEIHSVGRAGSNVQSNIELALRSAERARTITRDARSAFYSVPDNRGMTSGSLCRSARDTALMISRQLCDHRAEFSCVARFPVEVCTVADHRATQKPSTIQTLLLVTLPSMAR